MLPDENTQQWPMIPTNAFLYFPEGLEIKEGANDKQWRKIFEGQTDYDDYELKNLQALDKTLKDKGIKPHAWFSQANRLRFLQANKFKIDDTVKAIKTASQWRQTDFPLGPLPDAINTKLNSGAIYICGRDQAYRPIIVADMLKLKQYKEDIKPILNNMLEYVMQWLLVPGQVENYVMIINMFDIGVTDAGSATDLVSFTSNTYRSRLYASYLVNMGYWLNKGWNGLASKFVSENSLKKIKVSDQAWHEDMWKHIDRDTIEQKYGGTMGDMKEGFWPPSRGLLARNTKSPSYPLKTIEQYNNRYRQGQLAKTKVKKQLIRNQHQTPKKAEPEQQRKVSNILMGPKNPASQILSVGSKSSPLKSTIVIPRQQVIVPIRRRQFKLFFQDEKFNNLFKIS